MRARRVFVVALALGAPVIGALLGWKPLVRSPRVTRMLGAETLAGLAVSADVRLARAAIAELRARGPEGLEALFTVHRAVLAEPAGAAAARLWPRLREALEQVAQQRDAHASRLYWHTDLDLALEAARSSRRPILSLRLLGELDEELSCANSRFFRTVLYADPEVSALLRNRFVLHWRSVRPVPKLSVDFGDGRVLETTITGNSIHYVLAADGRTMDALPGLYGGAAFRRGLEEAAEAAATYASLDPAAAEEFLQGYHRRQVRELDADLQRDLERLGRPPLQAPEILFQDGAFTSWPEGTKARVELPVLERLVPGVRGLPSTIDDATWSALAALHAGETRLDEASRALARGKVVGGDGRPRADGAGEERRLAPAFLALERSLAEETVRNQQVYHRAIHGWLADGSAGADLEELNLRVYRELFLSPVSDEWLGIVPPDAYNGLDRGGLAAAGGRS